MTVDNTLHTQRINEETQLSYQRLHMIYKLFGSHKHVSLYVIVLDSHALSTTGTSR